MKRYKIVFASTEPGEFEISGAVIVTGYDLQSAVNIFATTTSNYLGTVAVGKVRILAAKEADEENFSLAARF
jgi:hypothetical protein